MSNDINLCFDLYKDILNESNTNFSSNYNLLCSVNNFSKIEYTTGKIKYLQNNGLQYTFFSSLIRFKQSTVPFNLNSWVYYQTLTKVENLENGTFLLEVTARLNFYYGKNQKRKNNC